MQKFQTDQLPSNAISNKQVASWETPASFFMGPPAENEQPDCQKNSLPRFAHAIGMSRYWF
jgi:hypothetical protein